MIDLDEIDRALAVLFPVSDGSNGYDLARPYVGWDTGEPFLVQRDEKPQRWQPTRRWDCAGMVVEAIVKRGGDLTVWHNGWEERWHAEVSCLRLHYGEGATAPEAISRAAAAALEAAT